MAVLDTEHEQFVCDGISVVGIEGEIDIATARAVHTRLTEKLAHGCVVADLGEVAFIDASGVNALVGAMREAARGSRHLCLAAPPRQLSRILDVLSLHSVMPTHPDTDSAVAAHTCCGRSRGRVPRQKV
ncbi:STAS domain-containing protein [Nocardiopsis xinjiangensis]|uniref:STAS domain-containing protein n=1 Tax=Nocardiopsis xinjiangensis TaxID=124285 RepID=UPI00034524DD|nr:STAS domain-containing protein [Nocardiopsis xinjiangensis]